MTAQREAELLPLDILHRRVGFQPQRLSRESRRGRIIRHLNTLSNPLKTRIENRDGRYRGDILI